MQLLGITQKVADCIIRPPRAKYTIQELGKPQFCYQNRIFERIDLDVPIPKKVNPQNLVHKSEMKTVTHIESNNNSNVSDVHERQKKEIVLKVSFYRDKYSLQPRDTVVYLHANSSSRISVKTHLQFLIKNFDIVAFDFRGCGLSENSSYLTLGYLQKYDVNQVIKYIDGNYGKRKYSLWGRSMGAVTALLYASKFKNIYGLVLDSPFGDLQKVVLNLADKNLPILPNFVTEGIMNNVANYIKGVILEEYGQIFNVNQLKPIKVMSRLRIPTFFIGSQNDQIVDIYQIKEMFNETAAMKQIQILEGGHNEIRPNYLKKKVVNFLLEAFKGQLPEQEAKKGRIFKYQQITRSSNPKSRSRRKSKVSDDKMKQKLQKKDSHQNLQQQKSGKKAKTSNKQDKVSSKSPFKPKRKIFSRFRDD